MNIENAVIITNKTRLESLIERFNTKAQAKFYIEHSGGNFSDYEQEHFVFKTSLSAVVEKLSVHFKCKVIDRSYLPNYIFTEKDLPVVLGQDGLVANTAKYVNGLPIFAINPDDSRYDGILLPHNINNFEDQITRIVHDRFVYDDITMAKATLNDGQTLLAFNDFFIGPASHISARYNIKIGNENENQSSSGIIVSTGAGSTGWLSSVCNQVSRMSETETEIDMDWDEDQLFFVVREPFESKHSKANIVSGYIDDAHPLIVESFMPQKGVIFSDGIEKDYLNFNSGAIVKIGLADSKAHIIV
ncbi:MAG: sugar kinase [Treponema sp.]|uniref:sugar kinase n=1 Tax=Treponema sp. TaxID=166 RepID=UPI00298D654E|nr:sugar kinase [Treponema sp.]MCR5387561.1 sugar kinase [Treponema sp.]